MPGSWWQIDRATTLDGMERMRASKIKHGLKTKEWLELSHLLAELRRDEAGGVEE